MWCSTDPSASVLNRPVNQPIGLIQRAWFACQARVCRGRAGPLDRPVLMSARAVVRRGCSSFERAEVRSAPSEAVGHRWQSDAAIDGGRTSLDAEVEVGGLV